eukprot:2822114-Prymnesium_polylepis.1
MTNTNHDKERAASGSQHKQPSSQLTRRRDSDRQNMYVSTRHGSTECAHAQRTQHTLAIGLGRLQYRQISRRTLGVDRAPPFTNQSAPSSTRSGDALARGGECLAPLRERSLTC